MLAEAARYVFRDMMHKLLGSFRSVFFRDYCRALQDFGDVMAFRLVVRVVNPLMHLKVFLSGTGLTGSGVFRYFRHTILLFVFIGKDSFAERGNPAKTCIAIDIYSPLIKMSIDIFIKDTLYQLKQYWRRGFAFCPTMRMYL